MTPPHVVPAPIPPDGGGGGGEDEVMVGPGQQPSSTDIQRSFQEFRTDTRQWLQVMNAKINRLESLMEAIATNMNVRTAAGSRQMVEEDHDRRSSTS